VIDDIFHWTSSRLPVRTLIRDRRKRRGFSDSNLGIAAVHVDARNGEIAAVHQVAAAARLTLPAVTAESTDTNPLTDLPSGIAISDCVKSGRRSRVPEH
jgi:hypothetical protein